MAKALDIEMDYNNIPNNLSTVMILNYLEFASNIIMLYDKKIFENDSQFDYYSKYAILDENIDIILEHLNLCKKDFEKQAEVILVEKILLQWLLPKLLMKILLVK